MIDPSSFLRRTAITVLTTCMITVLSESALATTVDEAQTRKTEAEESLNSINEEIADITYQQEILQDQINQLDSDLVNLLIEIDATETEVENKKLELAKTEEDLKSAKKTEHEHYESMKERICYIYENGEISVLDSLFGSRNFADMLNKVSNFDAMYSMDRDLLDEYTEIRHNVENLVNKIQQEETDLEELEVSLQAQQDDLEYEKETKYSELEDFDQQLAEAQTLATEYRSIISEMNNEIASAQTIEEEQESMSCTCDDECIEAAPETYYESYSGGSGSEVADYACQFVGNPYVWGGESLTNGCDCSGFVMCVYAHFGVSLPHSSSSLRSVGYGVSESEMQSGDIVCYDGHCAIYIGGGQIVHASNSREGIKISSNYAYREVITIRRIF